LIAATNAALALAAKSEADCKEFQPLVG